jgi:hypothetical protein
VCCRYVVRDVCHQEVERRTVEAHYYPGMGHGFNKRETAIEAFKRSIEFDLFLKNAR